MFSSSKIRCRDNDREISEDSSNNNMFIPNQSNDDSVERNTRIVIVGGWSPGPLHHLKQAVSALGCHEIIEPSQLNQFMPPFPGLWCCHPAFIIMAFMLGATVFLAVTASTTIFLRLLIVLLAFGWLRILVGVAVRTSIETSIRRIRQEGLEDGKDPNRILLIGFSWGGAVVAEMIARGMVGGVNQPSALLIAPTTSVVARLALQEDASLRIDKVDLAQNPTKVTVVHGGLDTSFCPHQDRWKNISGVDLQILSDNHVFMKFSSLRTLEQCLLRFLRQ